MGVVKIKEETIFMKRRRNNSLPACLPAIIVTVTDDPHTHTVTDEELKMKENEKNQMIIKSANTHTQILYVRSYIQYGGKIRYTKEKNKQ